MLQVEPRKQHLTGACLSFRLLSGRKIHSQEEALAVRRPSRSWHGTGGTAHSGEGTATHPWRWETGTPSGQRPGFRSASLRARGMRCKFCFGHSVGHLQLRACQVWVNPPSALLCSELTGVAVTEPCDGQQGEEPSSHSEGLRARWPQGGKETVRGYRHPSL